MIRTDVRSDRPRPMSRLTRIVGDVTPRLRRKLLGIYGALFALNVCAWIWALVAFRDRPLLLGSALLAYGLGLRHAVDADHIAAIDNVTRKLMQRGKRPTTVGLFFSLGHSTVVVLASLALGLAAKSLANRFDRFEDLGGVIGTLISGGFLLLIALINFVIFRSIYRAWRDLQRGKPLADDDFDLLLANRGFLALVLRPLFDLVTRSWHMYPLGFLFGLGFDTATEVGMLSLSAAQATQGLSPSAIVVFPLLFTAGMSLVDTLDSHLMLGAYGWAYMNPHRKLYYNMSITFVSIVVALVVGGIELLGLLCERLKLKGGLWDAIASINENFAALGYIVIGIFVVCWIASLLIYRARRCDEIGA